MWLHKCDFSLNACSFLGFFLDTGVIVIKPISLIWQIPMYICYLGLKVWCNPLWTHVWRSRKDYIIELGTKDISTTWNSGTWISERWYFKSSFWYVLLCYYYKVNSHLVFTKSPLKIITWQLLFLKLKKPKLFLNWDQFSSQILFLYNLKRTNGFWWLCATNTSHISTATLIVWKAKYSVPEYITPT